MDILSIIGLILAVGMVLFGIMFDSDTTRVVLGNLHAFWDYPSLAITIEMCIRDRVTAARSTIPAASF